MKILIIMGIVVRMRAEVAKVGNLVMLEILHFFWPFLVFFFRFFFCWVELEIGYRFISTHRIACMGVSVKIS